MFAVLSVPATYLPVLPSSPPTLIAQQTAHCRVRLFSPEVRCFRGLAEAVVTHSKSLQGESPRPATLILGRLHLVPLDLPLHTPTWSPHPSLVGTLAYVMFTSGTTRHAGALQEPVCVTHMNAARNVDALIRRWRLSPRDVVALCSPATFDPSIVECFGALRCGGTLAIPMEATRLSPQACLAFLKEAGATVLQTTPTFLRRLGSLAPLLTPSPSGRRLRLLALGGEAFPPLDELSMRLGGPDRPPPPDFEVWNIYGITEVSITRRPTGRPAGRYPLVDITHGGHHRPADITPPVSAGAIPAVGTTGIDINSATCAIFATPPVDRAPTVPTNSTPR
ncbi:putative acyl-CoA synthetase family member 4 [Paratrimastix pyriformis]|uniref:Acyl-CoA synthetase family member 4 n=1 Tax=Paratrimastix pyriformis TaxID=342808 RepID=A0ABQ8UXX1_9EUKA|nr:putative acyl-CoA synthetase family member 4 [Paratrimastix pyriformis]